MECSFTGLTAKNVLERLEVQSRYPLPPSVITEIEDYMGRYGILRLVKEEDKLILESDNELLFLEIVKIPEIKPLVESFINEKELTSMPIDAVF